MIHYLYVGSGATIQMEGGRAAIHDTVQEMTEWATFPSSLVEVIIKRPGLRVREDNRRVSAASYWDLTHSQMHK